MSHLRNLLHKPSGHEAAPHATTMPMKSDGVAAPAPFIAAAPAVTTSHAAPPDVLTVAPTLSEFPVEEAHFGPEARLVYYDDPRSPAADRYRLLRMRLKEHWRTRKLKKLLVTGALAHDGKSTVVLNLATALAERGKHSVLVIDADLHHASIADNLRLKRGAGLAECLSDEATPLLSVIRRVEPLGWYLLSAGEPRRNPTELLQTAAFGHLMQKLCPHFDWILIDSPPVVPLTDSLSLQQHADASLVVARAGATPRDAIEHTIALLEKKNIIGVVLNGIEARNHLYYQYNDYRRRDQDG